MRTNASWEDISECRSRWSVGEEHKTRVGAWEAERPSRPGTAQSQKDFGREGSPHGQRHDSE